MMDKWNQIIADFPIPHILQTTEWASVKSRFGWQPIYAIWVEDGSEYHMVLDHPGEHNAGEIQAAALILNRSVSPGLSMLYIPKGPLLKDWNNRLLRKAVMGDLEEYARNTGVIFLKMDPDVVLGTGIPGEEDAREAGLGQQIEAEWRTRGWVFSPDQVQYRNTVLVNLEETEEDLLMRMKSKTRYNIRYAARNGVKVRAGGKEDFALLYSMYVETSARGDFTIRDRKYYREVWDEFYPGRDQAVGIGPEAVPIIAEVEGSPVAGAVIFRVGKRAWYLHGMSTLEHKEKMPTYAVQWEIMRWAKSRGCVEYDMWGAPDIFEKQDPMWGVYRFKRGFGGRVVRTIGAWDYPVRPVLYRVYTRLLPRLLDILRYFRDRKTGQAASDQTTGE